MPKRKVNEARMEALEMTNRLLFLFYRVIKSQQAQKEPLLLVCAKKKKKKATIILNSSPAKCFSGTHGKWMRVLIHISDGDWVKINQNSNIIPEFYLK